MITSIHIQNFRCFGSTKATGFSRINLFGGKNNAGKTALLEALLLMGEPSHSSIAKILAFRMISIKMMQEMPEKFWDHLFYQQRKEQAILFNFSISGDDSNYKISLSCDEEVNMISDNTQDFQSTKSIKSFLQITPFINEKELQKSIFIASSSEPMRGGIENTFIETYFCSTNLKTTNEQLATAFSKAKLNGQSKELLKALKIIDKQIEEIDVFTIGTASVYLKRINEGYMLLSLFGDAMNKIADIILRIINNKNSILLIDEIENGIHYENQEEVWRILFELCETYNVQLFATSHSYEMIEAFKDCAIKYDKNNQASYFEMLRHPISSQIVIQKIPMDSLEDKLNNQRPIRGEQKNQRKSS